MNVKKELSIYDNPCLCVFLIILSYSKNQSGSMSLVANGASLILCFYL